MAEDRQAAVISPTLGETARRRADLHAALVAVERASSSPATGREHEWVEGVLGALRDVAHEIDDHIEITERPDGLYAEIMETAPRLAHGITRLKDEHPVMRETTKALIDRLETQDVGTTWSVDDVRDELQRLLGLMVKHRQRGADLVWQAYTLDIGGID